jgi:hypothetical protein
MQMNNGIEGRGENVNVASRISQVVQRGVVDAHRIEIGLDERAHIRREVPADSSPDVPAVIQIASRWTDRLRKSAANIEGEVLHFLRAHTAGDK